MSLGLKGLMYGGFSGSYFSCSDLQAFALHGQFVVPLTQVCGQCKCSGFVWLSTLQPCHSLRNVVRGRYIAIVSILKNKCFCRIYRVHILLLMYCFGNLFSANRGKPE